MPEFWACPPEILDLIIDELAAEPVNTRELACSIQRRLSRRILPLGLTCRFFHRFLLPRLYSTCVLEFRGPSDKLEGQVYRLYDRSALNTLSTYNGFLRNGTLVRNLDIRFEPVDWELLGEDRITSTWPEFQEVSQSLPKVLGKLAPKFDGLTRAVLRWDIDSRGSLGEFVHGVYIILSRVASLTAIDLSIQYGIDDQDDWISEGIAIDYSASMAQLTDLNLSIEPKLSSYGYEEDPIAVEISQCLWFMDTLIDLLNLPSQTTKRLSFELMFEELETPLGQLWITDGKIIATKTGKKLQLPLLCDLYLAPDNGCRFAFEQYLEFPFEKVTNLGLQLATYSGVTWTKEVSFASSFRNLKVINLYLPRNIKLVEGFFASLPHLPRLKELTVFLFHSSSQVIAIMDRFEKEPKVQIKKSVHEAGYVTMHLCF